MVGNYVGIGRTGAAAAFDQLFDRDYVILQSQHMAGYGIHFLMWKIIICKRAQNIWRIILLFCVIIYCYLYDRDVKKYEAMYRRIRIATDLALP